ncbi:recombinase family protein [Phenylobacterium sp.]|jgi:DNA invertase Pin-like site-specific DNA recombinase|uniref:recombinase family protein n=1 Tax=Phenylobacterium sp. TaxID=1871053 RepID=UPI002F930702
MTAAVQYIRTSTRGQSQSGPHQKARNLAYAAAHDLRIIRTYEDIGASGLRLQGRTALVQLFRDVLACARAFEVILVHDVSRWGRFQDCDEGAHYEQLCREAGVAVVYTAEPFQVGAGPVSTLLKQLKRAMAAEYSRVLSARVTSSRARLATEGCWLGGTCGYGLRRVARAEAGPSLGTMELGQRKAVRTARTLLERGPTQEHGIVLRIYRLFVDEELSPTAIARMLNSEGVPSELRGPWTRAQVRQILANEKYAGVQVSGRSATQLGRSERRPPAEWRRSHLPFAPIVPPGLFARGRRRLIARSRRPSDAELLQDLARVLACHGRISAGLILADAACRHPSTYSDRFGGLMAAYARIGYAPDAGQVRAMTSARTHRPHTARRYQRPSRDRLINALRVLLERHGRLSAELIRAAPGAPHPNAFRLQFGSLREAYRQVGYDPPPRGRRPV